MKPIIDEKKDGKVTMRVECRAEETDGGKHVERVELKTREEDTVKYVERKLVEKGVGRLDRNPADGLPLKHQPKKGHGGKYTWEGLETEFQAEMEAEAALDDKDPNYVAEEEAAPTDEAEVVVGEVEVAKAVGHGVARVEIDPHLKVN